MNRDSVGNQEIRADGATPSSVRRRRVHNVWTTQRRSILRRRWWRRAAGGGGSPRWSMSLGRLGVSWRHASAAVFALALVVGVLTIAGAQGGAQVAVSSGIYAEVQAERGQVLFAARCAHCHGRELGGGMGPALAPLNAFWQGQTVASMFGFVSNNMPMDMPRSLSLEEYADAISFILKSNGYPAGEQPLPANVDALTRFVFDPAPAAQAAPGYDPDYGY